MSNKVKFGLKNVNYAPITETSGVVTYETPVKIPGAVNLTLSPEGDPVEFYADDILYFSASTNAGYTGDVEFALIPDSFKKDILGYKEDNNGVLFEDSQAIPKNFALLFEFTGDKNAVRHVLYNVNAARPNLESTTKTKSTEVQTETMSIVVAPAIDTGLVKAKVTPTQQVQYESWYTTVYTYVEPVEGV